MEKQGAARGDEGKQSSYVVMDSSPTIALFPILLLIAFSSTIHIPLRTTIAAFLIGVLLTPLYMLALKNSSAFWGGLIGLSAAGLGIYSKYYFINNKIDGRGLINVTLAVGIGVLLVSSIFRKKLQERIKKTTSWRGWLGGDYK